MENKSEPYISVIYQRRVPAGTVKLLRESPVQGDAVRTLLSQVRKADQTTAKTACNRGGGGGMGGWGGGWGRGPSGVDTAREENGGEGKAPQSGR